jgi:hypothetical protein
MVDYSLLLLRAHRAELEMKRNEVE